MNKRKVSSKQEREALILSFLSSGQTKTLWCKENNISLPTLYRWLKSYPTTKQEVSFVALKPKKIKTVEAKQQATATNAHIVVEIGVCKVHMTKQCDISFIAQLIQEVNASHV